MRGELDVHVHGPLDLAQRPLGVLAAPRLHVPAGESGNGRMASTSRTAGDRRDTEHGPPAVAVAQQVVDEVGDEDPDGDGQLVERDEAATQPGRGHLGRVERCGDRGHADPEPDHSRPSTST